MIKNKDIIAFVSEQYQPSKITFGELHDHVCCKEENQKERG